MSGQNMVAITPTMTPVQVQGALLRVVISPEGAALLDQGIPAAYILNLYPLQTFKTQQKLLGMLTGGETRGVVQAERLLLRWHAAWQARGLDEMVLGAIPNPGSAGQGVQVLRPWMWEQALSRETVRMDDDDYNRPRILLWALTAWLRNGDQPLGPDERWHAEREDMIMRAAHLWVDFTTWADAS